MYASETLNEPSGSKALWIIPTTLAVLLGFFAFQEWVAPRQQPATVTRSSPPVRAAPVVRPAGASLMDETTTYYVVGSEEARRSAAGVLAALRPDAKPAPGGPPTYLIVVITSDEQEARLRSTIDAATAQTDAHGEPGFRIVDLR